MRRDQHQLSTLFRLGGLFMSATRTHFWQIRYVRFIAFIFCSVALAGAAFRVAESARAAGSSQAAPQKSKPVSAVQAKASSRAAAALEKVKARATSTITSHVARETGNYDFVRANDGGVLAADNSSATAEQRALGFLREHGGLVGMSDAERASAANSGSNARGVSELKVKQGCQRQYRCFSCPA